MKRTVLASVLAALIALTALGAVPWAAAPARAAGGTLAGWRICVDAGHGGSEFGAVNTTLGLKEKDVNLAVARQLRDLLAADGADVKMTRDSDVYVGINQRYEYANSIQATLFISIHHNAVSDKAVNGTETYVGENASVTSWDLARRAQTEMVREFGLQDRGVGAHYAGVLNHTVMPAILTEASYISNDAQAKLLKDPAYLLREAQAIARSIQGTARVSILSPTQREMVAGEQAITLKLLDPTKVTRATYYVDGEPQGVETQAPFTHNLDTTTLTDGQRSVQVDVAYDDGNTYAIAQDLLVANEATTWYFAEGTTRAGFDAYLSVLNPNPGDTTLTATFFFSDGTPALERTYPIPGQTRFTLPVNAVVGEGKDLSCLLQAESPVIAERPQYFTYNGTGKLGWQGGHTVMGANAADWTWYFAEGCTRGGFEEYLCIFNPGDEAARVNVNYMPSAGAVLQRVHQVPAHSRKTIFVNADAGPGLDLSVELTSTEPIVVERPMYFNYGGSWEGGSNVIGTTDIHTRGTSWSFAEGYTGTGFDEWLCIQNPQSTANSVTLTYLFADGTAPISSTVVIERFRRLTVSVDKAVGEGREVSVQLSAQLPVVAERSIYQNYKGWGRGGDVAMGAASPANDWFLAEGCTRPGFEQYLTLMNPATRDVSAVVTFSAQDGDFVTKSFTLKAESRFTLLVNDYMKGKDVSISLHASLPVIAERALYFIYEGQAGSSAGGGYSPGAVR